MVLKTKPDRPVQPPTSHGSNSVWSIESKSGRTEIGPIKPMVRSGIVRFNFIFPLSSFPINGTPTLLAKPSPCWKSSYCPLEHPPLETTPLLFAGTPFCLSKSLPPDTGNSIPQNPLEPFFAHSSLLFFQIFLSVLFFTSSHYYYFSFVLIIFLFHDV